MIEDLAARVAELAAVIEARLADDERYARVMRAAGERQKANPAPGMEALAVSAFAAMAADPEAVRELGHWGHRLPPNDLDRIDRRVKATRDLVAAILAEPHDYIPGDEYYSCSQAIDPYPGESGEPGSGCSDPERAGKPCDCGRDQRVARLLGIIAGEWEDTLS